MTEAIEAAGIRLWFEADTRLFEYTYVLEYGGLRRRYTEEDRMDPKFVEVVSKDLSVEKTDVVKLFCKLPEIGSKPPFVLEHITQIENPKLAGKPIVVEALVSSTSTPYLVPTELNATFEDTDGFVGHDQHTIRLKDPENLMFVAINEDVKHRRLRRLFGQKRNLTIEEERWRTVYWVRVRPPVFTLEKRGERIIDERGFEYKAYDIYVTSTREITFPAGSLIRLEGIVVPHPKSQKTTILAYEVEFPEESTAFDLEKLWNLLLKLQPLSVKKRLDWILNNFESYSQIVGRRSVALACLLNKCTPTWVKFNGDIQKGWGNTAILGDTTTAKSETARKLIMLTKTGMLITAETATAVGLLGTATQVGSEGWFIEWGLLVLCDRKELIVDGAHKLSSSQWAVLAEAERTGVVTIIKAGKGTAYVRTRQTKIANAVDRENRRYSTKDLKEFLYPCQGLPTWLDRTSIARLDATIFVSRDDVTPEEINTKFEGEYDEDLQALGDIIRWCWSNTTDVQYTETAVNTILDEATKLYNTFFCGMIPLVSIDMKWKLARLSTALAYLTLSTEDFEIVTVTEDHVQEVVDFLRDEYVKASLNVLAKETRYEALTLEDVNLVFYEIIEKTKAGVDEEKIKDIVKFIALHGRSTRDDLMVNYGLSENSELRPLLAVLKKEKWIKSGNGLYATPSLIQAYKLLIKDIKDIKGGEEPLKDMGDVRFLQDVPEFTGSDLKRYGPFKRGDVATLPIPNADGLIKRRVVVAVETRGVLRGA